MLAVLLLAIGLVAPSSPAGAASVHEAAARRAAERFLDSTLRQDGRVVRFDQGGDTVSEGQAYAMLVAAGIGDESRFATVWSWTKRHLQRADGLLSWWWANGAVRDPSPAADADLLAAAALALAGQRFGEPSYVAEAKRIGDAVLRLETVKVGGEQLLVAGPWARASRTVNPSYLVTVAMSKMWWTGQHGWAPVARTARTHLDVLTRHPPHLPPDWAVGDEHGGIRASAAPSGTPPRFGFDAARVTVQGAVDCTPTGRQIAARSWRWFDQYGSAVPAVSDLAGRPQVGWTHTVTLVSAAGAASAAGRPARVVALLDDAERHEQRWSSYYGSAWLALGRLWLTTRLLEGCAPVSALPLPTASSSSSWNGLLALPALATVTAPRRNQRW